MRFRSLAQPSVIQRQATKMRLRIALLIFFVSRTMTSWSRARVSVFDLRGLSTRVQVYSVYAHTHFLVYSVYAHTMSVDLLPQYTTVHSPAAHPWCYRSTRVSSYTLNSSECLTMFEERARSTASQKDQTTASLMAWHLISNDLEGGETPPSLYSKIVSRELTPTESLGRQVSAGSPPRMPHSFVDTDTYQSPTKKPVMPGSKL